MTSPLTITTVLYAGVLAVWIATRSIRQAPPSQALIAALLVLEAALVALASIDAVAVFASHRPRDLAVHLAYVGAAVIVVPVAMLIGSGARKGIGMAGAVGCAAAVVIVLRMRMTAA